MGDLNAGGGRGLEEYFSNLITSPLRQECICRFVQGAGWIDWNLLLNEDGGPNHVGNVCDAPVIASLRLGVKDFVSASFYVSFEF